MLRTRPQFAILAAIAVAGTAAAQNDTIHTTDGKKIEKVRVTGYDFKSLNYRSGADEQQLPRDKVLKVEVQQPKVVAAWKDAARAELDEQFQTAFEEYNQATEKLAGASDTAPFAQFAAWKAFQLAVSYGTDADRAATLATLKKMETTAYWPDIWHYEIGQAWQRAGQERPKLEAAKKLVEQFAAFVKDKDLSERYVLEAELELALARARLKEVSAKQTLDELSKLLPKVEGTYPDLANQVNLEFAFAVLADGRADDARKLFGSIVGSKIADDATKARALVGRGHTWLQKTGAAADDFKQALLDYMRVVVVYENTDEEITGEALYHAAQAYEKWNGPEAQVNVRRLRGRLRQTESTWRNK